MIYIIEQGPAVPLPARRSIAGPAVPLPGPAVLFHYILYQSNTYIYIYNLYDLYNRARPGGSWRFGLGFWPWRFGLGVDE